MTAVETGNLWVCGVATNGQFVSCPIPKRVRSVSAAGRVVACTLEDGEVLIIDLENKPRAKNGRGPETGATSEAPASPVTMLPWKAVATTPALDVQLSSGDFGVLLSAQGEVFTWGPANKWGELGVGGQHGNGNVAPSTAPVDATLVKVAGSVVAKKVCFLLWRALRPVKLHLYFLQIVAVAAGSTHAMAISESGALFSWGRGFEGQTAQPGNGALCFFFRCAVMTACCYDCVRIK
jgi:hypothetical protein